MKVKLTEKQYSLLLEYIEESRKAPTPQKLSLFFNDNPNAQFFSVIQRDKNGYDSDYDFKLTEVNGYKVIVDINKGTKTKGCSVDASFDTMIYGTQLIINFGKCGKLTINNVVGLKIFNDVNSLKNGTPDDTFELDHNMDKTKSDLVLEYYEQLKSVEIGDDINFDSKFKYDGNVVQRHGDVVRVELSQQGRENTILILTIDLGENPFYEEEGNLMFKAKSSKGNEEQKDFILPIKNFYVDKNGQEEPEIKKEKKKKTPPNEVDKDEELRKEGKRAMEMILNDPNLKKAFYTQPSLWNLFISELRGEQAVGKGIVPTLRIINSYERKSISENLGGEFIEGKKISFIPADDVDVTFNIGDKEDFFPFKTTDKEYNPRVLDRKLGENFKLFGRFELDNITKKYNLGYELEIIKNVENTPDTFECKVTIITSLKSVSERIPFNGNLIIKIIRKDIDSYGYQPKQKTNQ